LADAVLVVGERDSTKVDELRRTRAALTRLAAPVVGVVLTGEPQTEDLWDIESEDDQEDEDEERLDDTEQLLMGRADKAPVSASPAGPAGPPPGIDDPPREDGGNGYRARENGAAQDESREHEPADTVAVAKWDAPEA
jgi:hypothetical protein